MIETIRLSPGDRLETALHLLDNCSATKALIVLPLFSGTLLTEPVDMARLRQHAHQAGVEIVLATLNPWVWQAARAAGVRVAPFVALARWRLQHPRPWWWPQAGRPGKPSKIDAGDRRAMHKRLASRPRWQRYSYRYVAIILFAVTLAIVTVAAFYALPQATITLKPQLRPVRIRREIIADPRFDEESAAPDTVPGRLLVYVGKWRADVQTTGQKEVPVAPARGLVTFVNRVPQAATIPAGTRVSTSTGTRVIFQTVETAEMPAQLGAEVDVEAVALEPGPQGNLPAQAINRVEGALAPQVNVRNLFPMSGGASQIVPAVREEDKERLRTHVLQTLMELARNDMRTQLEDDQFLVDDSIRLIVVYEETYSHFTSEETPRLTLEMRAELHGTAVSEAEALQAVEQQLYESVPPGYSILPESVSPRIGAVMDVDQQGRVEIEMLGEAIVAADLALQQPLRDIRGQDAIVAQYYLREELPLRDLPSVTVWPERFNRIPFVRARIYTRIDTES